MTPPMTVGEIPALSFLDVVSDAENAALAAVRAALSAPGGLTGAHQRLRLATSLRIMDQDIAQWLIYDGRAVRDRSDHVYLDTTALSQPYLGLPDIVDGGAMALDIYLTSFATTLTHAGYYTRLIKNSRRATGQVDHSPSPRFHALGGS